MIRLREDVDGCGCVRCQEAGRELPQRSLGGALVWSAALPFARPSVLLVLLGVVLVQVASAFAPEPLSLALLSGALLGVFAGRGYIGVVGRDALASRRRSPVRALATVARRLPVFVGAVFVVALGLVGVVGVVVTLVSPALATTAAAVGVDPTAGELATILTLATLVVFVLLKCCFVPEACFVGGYGPIAALRASWLITTVDRRNAVFVFGGFLALFAVGAAFDTQLAGADAPLVLSIELHGTTVVLRSFGLSLTSATRSGFDLLATAVYSGVFVHQYAASAVTASRE